MDEVHGSVSVRFTTVPACTPMLSLFHIGSPCGKRELSRTRNLGSYTLFLLAYIGALPACLSELASATESKRRGDMTSPVTGPNEGQFVFVLGYHHALLRYGLSLILGKAFPDAIIREAGDSDSLHCAMATQPIPTVLLLDIGVDGIATVLDISCLRRIYPETPILALSGADDLHLVHQAIQQGVHGFLSKTALGGSRSLVSAIRSVLSGSVYLPLSTVQALLLPAKEFAALLSDSDHSSHNRAQSAEMVQREDLARLTQRQRNVFDLLAQGKSNRKIAEYLEMAEGTVRIHISSILRALKVPNRGVAAQAALRWRWISDTDGWALSETDSTDTCVHDIKRQRK